MKTSTYQKTAYLVLVFLMIFSFLILLGSIRNNRVVGKENQTFLRATNCFAATSPDKRTPGYVKDCYDQAEQATGVIVTRYGDGK